ncbi:translocation/assembly module TamB domain-containing protein [Qipengyuania sediminis]|uniref:translocation/assembly module TamB domain-containing protein n=1 Tax=Qipengyuania sediminis TaxID=1532023 RepID=UPI001059CF4C|nr:translocation/assembly module TamB domain-containing protein [Qipengyuania sediminis]
MAGEAAAPQTPLRRSRARRAALWVLGVLAALVLLVVAAVALLNTPIGQRALTDRIAAQTLPNGLNIRIGRIEGNLYGKAVLRDVRLYDLKGVFATIPRAEIDWRPTAWLRNTLDIRSFAARRATLLRTPTFKPGNPDDPVLPGFDISIDRLVIDNLTLAPGIAGARAQRVDLNGEVQVTDKRLEVRSRGRFGRTDSYAFVIDAEPDGNDFDMALDYRAAADGPVAEMLGAKEAYRARVGGDGTWRDWKGFAVVQRGGERFGSFRVLNRAGQFRVTGQARPGDMLTGTLAGLAGETVSLDATARIAERKVDGRYALATQALFLRAAGLMDLANNRAEALKLDARMRRPLDLGGTRLENAALLATADGEFTDLAIDHTLTVGRLVAGTTVLDNLVQRGTATRHGTVWTLPLDARVARVRTGTALVDPRLVDGTLNGTIRLAGNRLSSDRLRLAFPNTAADGVLTGDLARGTYRLDGMVNASGLALESVGRVSGSAKIVLDIGGRVPWALSAGLSARIAPVTNSTLANLGGNRIAVRGGLNLGANRPIAFNRLVIDGPRLDAVLNGRVQGGRTTLAGRGRQADFGPFTVEATIAGDGPRATLVFANPYPAAGLRNVRVAIRPAGNGFAIQTSGQSLLGPFNGDLGLVIPRGGATRIDIERLRVTDTNVTGALTLGRGAVGGNVALSGGGLDGTVLLSPRGGGQGVDVDLRARNASFGGTTPLTIARADIKGQGVFAQGNSTFTGTARGAGLGYGSLFIGRFAAQGRVVNGVGQLDASIAGRRAQSFALDLNAQFASSRIAVAARGELAGRRIQMPRRAVLTAIRGGGWQLAPTQVNFGGGGMIAQGRFGGGETELGLQLNNMPLSLLDIVVADLGVGGTVSGLVDYRVGRGGLPQATARVLIDDLTRSGLVLTSKPVDLALVANLTASDLTTRAVFRNEDIRTGRLQARIAGLPAGRDLVERLRAGRLFAQLRYQGAAESLWRLAAIEAFDMTGPVSIAADATGSLARPLVRGAVSSDALRIRSALSGTDLRNVRMRGSFSGSRLAIRSFAGKADNGGDVSGSGIVDLAGLGERVQGQFLQARGPRIDLRAAARGARLLNANGLSATITGPLRIVSNGLGGTIAGRVRVDRASWGLGGSAAAQRLPRIATREVNVPDERGPANAVSAPWRYLINASADSRIDVDGMGLDSEWSANILLRGTTDAPRIGGEARVVRGAYSFAGTRFELTKGIISFDENVPVNPRLDIEAETSTNGLTVKVDVTGNSIAPEIDFSSTPSLPEEEILARLLFGGSVTSLSATDALQLGAAVASLRGGGGMDPINRLRTAIGLDRLRIVPADPTLDRETSIALGKNIGRRFYVELITDGRGYSATALEFRVTSWLSLLATVSTVGRQSATARVSRDY